MDIYVLNTELDALSVIDTYESFIWTERYYENGDFELYAPVTDALLQYLKQDNYLQLRSSNRLMIVEKIEIDSDVEEGTHVTVTGRSLESILDRRVVWGQETLKGNLQNEIKRLLELCIISPSNTNRKIPNFIFKASTDPTITGLEIEAQYTGDNLYEVIQAICEERSIGFRITLNENKQFVFELYSGTDRSYDQNRLPYVTFSSRFDNIISSNYMESNASLKNVALIGGEGEGAARKYAAVGNLVGLTRRELFVDARDISSDVGDGKTLTPEEYTNLLAQRGKEKLAENDGVTSFEGEMETSIMYKYGEDFFEGDIVQIEDEYGHESKVRVLEVVTSHDEEGFSTYPTFKTLEDEEERRRLA